MSDISHLNGYNIKDAIAREKIQRIEEDARQARSAAEEARTNSLQLAGELDPIRQTATRAETAAKTAYNTATAALPKSGGDMGGNINMNGKNIIGVGNLGAFVLFLQSSGGEVTAEASTTPGVVNFQHYKKPAPGDVIIRGVKAPANPNDAANKAYVDAATGPDMIIKIYGGLGEIVRGSYEAVSEKLVAAEIPAINVVEMIEQTVGYGETNYTAKYMKVDSLSLADGGKEPYLEISVNDGESAIFVYPDGSVEV